MANTQFTGHVDYFIDESIAYLAMPPDIEYLVRALAPGDDTIVRLVDNDELPDPGLVADARKIEALKKIKLDDVMGRNVGISRVISSRADMLLTRAVDERKHWRAAAWYVEFYGSRVQRYLDMVTDEVVAHISDGGARSVRASKKRIARCNFIESVAEVLREQRSRAELALSLGKPNERLGDWYSEYMELPRHWADLAPQKVQDRRHSKNVKRGMKLISRAFSCDAAALIRSGQINLECGPFTLRVTPGRRWCWSNWPVTVVDGDTTLARLCVFFNEKHDELDPAVQLVSLQAAVTDNWERVCRAANVWSATSGSNAFMQWRSQFQQPPAPVSRQTVNMVIPSPLYSKRKRYRQHRGKRLWIFVRRTVVNELERLAPGCTSLPV